MSFVISLEDLQALSHAAKISLMETVKNTELIRELAKSANYNSNMLKNPAFPEEALDQLILKTPSYVLAGLSDHLNNHAFTRMTPTQLSKVLYVVQSFIKPEFLTKDIVRDAIPMFKDNNLSQQLFNPTIFPFESPQSVQLVSYAINHRYVNDYLSREIVSFLLDLGDPLGMGKYTHWTTFKESFNVYDMVKSQQPNKAVTDLLLEARLSCDELSGIVDRTQNKEAANRLIQILLAKVRLEDYVLTSKDLDQKCYMYADVDLGMELMAVCAKQNLAIPDAALMFADMPLSERIRHLKKGSYTLVSYVLKGTVNCSLEDLEFVVRRCMPLVHLWDQRVIMKAYMAKDEWVNVASIDLLRMFKRVCTTKDTVRFKPRLTELIESRKVTKSTALNNSPCLH